MEIQVDGIHVSFEKCHCGAVPSEADARQSIKERQSICDYCNEPIKVTYLQMQDHRSGPNGNTWSGSWGREPSIEMGSYSQLGDYRKEVHIRCWEKIFGDKLPADVRR